MSFSFEEREKYFRQIQGKTWDLLIIGGGITGAAVARDASLRGLRPLLLEAGDFASGTSSGSTKLLHGGVRYLENFEFKLVRDAIVERELLRKLYAPFVKDLEFVFPTYKNSPPPRWKLNIGLFLYDAFSGFRHRHLNLDQKATIEKFPFLEEKNLTGACLYYDSFAEDYRLVIELIKAAHRRGALCLNRVQVDSIQSSAEGEQEVRAKDNFGSLGELNFKARFIINCSGPFSDRVRGFLGLQPTLQLTQGVHFLVSRKLLPIDQAFVMSEPKQHRILFAIPWGSSTYMGTTDTSIQRPEEAQARSQDLDYVLASINQHFKTKIERKDIHQSWAAVRPLIKPSQAQSNSQVSREHMIEENPKGVFHVLGGKLTSHRLMAEEVLNSLAQELPMKDCKTHRLPLQEALWDERLRSPIAELSSTFGQEASQVLKLDEKLALNRKKLNPGYPTLESEVHYSIKEEMALEPMDFLRRRSSLYYHTNFQNESDLEMITRCAHIFARELGYSEIQQKASIEKCFDAYRWDRKALS